MHEPTDIPRQDQRADLREWIDEQERRRVRDARGAHPAWEPDEDEEQRDEPGRA